MASFLWRSDDLRRLRTRHLVIQSADGTYPPEDALLRFVDASGVVGAAGLFVDNSGNLLVTGSVDISGGLTVGGSADISGDLSVTGDADICGNLTVGSMTIDTLTLVNLFVTGSVDISGGLTVGGTTDLSGDLLVDGSGSFGGSVSVTNNLHVGGTTDLSGDLLVDGSGSFGGSVSVTNNLHVGGTTDLSGDLYVYGFITASGDVISNSGLSLLSINNIGVGTCEIFSNSANDLGPQFKSFKMRDGSGAVLAGDELGRINFFGLDTAGASSYGPAAAKIEAFATDNFTSSSKPANLRFATTRMGDISAAEHMILTSEGALQVKHTTFGGDYIEQNLVDPSDGQTRFMRDYMVGQNDFGFGGKAYRNHRYVYDASANTNANVWGIVNDSSGGNLGDIEFYQNVTMNKKLHVESDISANANVYVGTRLKVGSVTTAPTASVDVCGDGIFTGTVTSGGLAVLYAIGATAGVSPATATLDTYTNRDIHGYSDKGYSVFTVNIANPNATGSITNPGSLSPGLWSVMFFPPGDANIGAQVSAICYWDGAVWTGCGVSTSWTEGTPNSPNVAILPTSPGSATLSLGGSAKPADPSVVIFRQLLAAP